MALGLIKKSCSNILLILALILFFAVPHSVAGKKITHFIADQVMTSPDGQIQNNSKIFVTPEKIRIDNLMPEQQNSQNISAIYLTENKEQIMINHTKKLYSISVLDEALLKQYTQTAQSSEKVKVIGKEKVNGYKCTIKETSQTFKMMGMTMNMNMTTWVSDKFQMPLRTKTEDGTVTELKNINKTKPKSSVFSIPKGYKKVASMMEAMGMDMPANMPQTSPGAPGTQTGMPEGMNMEDALKGLQDAMKNMPKQ